MTNDKIIVGTAVVLVAMAQSILLQASANEAYIVMGAALIEERCVACHAAESLPGFAQRASESRGPEF